MKKSNKLAALLMAATLVLAATACDSTPASSDSSAAPEPSSSSVPESSSSQVLTAPEREYIKGVTTGKEYVNEFWGVKFTSPSEDIMLATPEQITELLGYGTDALGTDPALAETMKAQLSQYEMAAIDMKTGTMLMLMSVDLPLSGVSPEIYISGILEGVKVSGSEINVELDNEGKSFKETVAGKEFTCISYTMKGTETLPDNHQTQRILIDGKRALIITSTYPPTIEAAKAKEAELLAAVVAVDTVA